MAFSMSSGVSITPKHFFGLNSNVKNSLFIVQDTSVMYPAGHNVVHQKIHVKNAPQFFLPGSEGTEEITHLAISPKKQEYVAVCERNQQGKKGQVTIWEIIGQKKKIVLPDDDEQRKTITSPEFRCSAFRPQEINHLVTLGGDQVIIWDWKNVCIISHIDLTMNPQINLAPSQEARFQISWNSNMNQAQTEGQILITGPDCFQYLVWHHDLKDKLKSKLAVQWSQLSSQNDILIDSTNFTCHAWNKSNADILVCTDAGDMIVCDNSGEFKAVCLDAQKGHPIECVISLEDGGFLIAFENSFLVYRTSTNDPRAPLKKIGDRTTIIMATNETNFIGNSIKIKSMALNSDEDTVYVVTNQGQLLKANINIAEYAKHHVETKFSYVTGQFHKAQVPNLVAQITGLDVCIRKQLVVTCSNDKTVNIWNYGTCTLEIQKQFNDECTAVAFHPSGLHLIVSTNDKINMCNILSNDLNNFHQLQGYVRCSEIKFSNGGHLFACVVMEKKKIHVFNWYTADKNPVFSFDGHPQPIKEIDWFENDLGFTTCAADGAVFFWDLYNYSAEKKPEELKRHQDADFNVKNVAFTSVVNVPGRQYQVYVVGNDKKIHSNLKVKKEGVLGETTDEQHLSVPTMVSQLVITRSAKFLLAGAGQVGSPGEIQVWLRPDDDTKPLQIINSVQAHSQPVNILRLTHDSKCLFSVGMDNMLCYFDVKDMSKNAKLESDLRFSNQILTQDSEMEKFVAEQYQLTQDLSQLRDTNNAGVERKLESKKQQDEITHYTAEIKEQKESEEQQLQSRKITQRDNAQMAQKKQTLIMDENQTKIEQERNEHSQKMLEDAAKFQELQTTKDLERQNAQKALDNLRETHATKMAKETEDHRKKIEVVNSSIDQKKREIRQIIDENVEIIAQINTDTKFELEDIQSKNEKNLINVQEMKLKSKAELDLTKNKHDDINKEIGKMEREQADMGHKIAHQSAQVKEKETIIENTIQQIRAKDDSIAQREKKIFLLKKKTQDLEKFKFVLDFKIKQLKEEITPMQNEILSLKEKTKDMDNELKKFNKTNANLGYIVDELRTKQDEIQHLISKYKTKIRKNKFLQNSQMVDVYEVLQHQMDPEMLRRSVNANLFKYIENNEQKDVEIDGEIKKEFESQKKYLESSFITLTKAYEHQKLAHKNDNKNIMEENIKLIEQISELRRNLKLLDQEFVRQGGKKQMEAKQQALAKLHPEGSAENSDQDTAPDLMSGDEADVNLDPVDGYDNSIDRNLEVNKQEIAQLRAHIAQLEQENKEIKRGGFQGQGDD